MKTTEELKEFLAKIEKAAGQKTNYEEAEGDPYGYNPGDNGNYDDAHSDGIGDGEIYMAREVLPVLKELIERLR